MTRTLNEPRVAGVGNLPMCGGSSRGMEPCGSCWRALGLFRDSPKGAMTWQ